MRRREEGMSGTEYQRQSRPIGSDNFLELIASYRQAYDVANSLKSILGTQLREIRRSRGQTQESLAAQLGVTPRYLAGIERGERNLTLDSLESLAARLGVDARVLLVIPE